jgi:microcystin-dependent protein
MAQPYVGEIRIFAGNFAPAGWMFCDGQLLPISENETLFNLIGTTYGGDGQSTFALPDLRGRVPLHMGNGFTLAQTGGVETVTLTTTQIPAHGHPLLTAGVSGDAQHVSNNVLADGTGGLNPYQPAVSGTPMNATSLNNAGGSQPHDNMQPYLVLDFIISLFGIFPSQT